MRHTKIVSLLIITLLQGCATVGHEFCISNGYPEDSLPYKQCTLRYKTDRELYDYCASTQGLVKEGQALNQCITSARQLKNAYTQESLFCQEAANNKFVPLFQQPKHEKQPTLQPNGLVTLDDIQLNIPYNNDEMASYTAPFINACLQSYGWNNPGAWQSGKHTVSMESVKQTLSRLNQQPLLVNVPINPVADLFKAVSENNIGLVRDIIRRGMGVNTQNYQGYTALHVAIKQGNFQMTSLLLEELGASLDVYSAQGENAIAVAGRSTNPGMISYISDVIRRRDAQRIREQEQRIRHEQERAHQREMDALKPGNDNQKPGNDNQKHDDHGDRRNKYRDRY